MHKLFLLITALLLTSVVYAQSSNELRSLIKYESFIPDSTSPTGKTVDSVSISVDVFYSIDSVQQVAFQFENFPWNTVLATDSTHTQIEFYESHCRIKSPVVEYVKNDSIKIFYLYENNLNSVDTSSYTIIY